MKFCQYKILPASDKNKVIFTHTKKRGTRYCHISNDVHFASLVDSYHFDMICTWITWLLGSNLRFWLTALDKLVLTKVIMSMSCSKWRGYWCHHSFVFSYNMPSVAWVILVKWYLTSSFWSHECKLTLRKILTFINMQVLVIFIYCSWLGSGLH